MSRSLACSHSMLSRNACRLIAGVVSACAALTGLGTQARVNTDIPMELHARIEVLARAIGLKSDSGRCAACGEVTHGIHAPPTERSRA